MMPLPYPLIEGYFQELRDVQDRRRQAQRAPARFVRWCARRAAAVRSRVGSVQRRHAPSVGSLHGSP